MRIQPFKAVVLSGVAALFFFGLAACTQQPAGPPLSPLAERGRGVYVANCVVCHNANPKLNGPVGPLVAGSSMELLKAKVLSGTYPPGHTPKRSTSAMAPLPQLKNDIEALEAFLNGK